MMTSILKAALDILGLGIDRAFPDKVEAQKLKTQITQEILALETQKIEAASKVIIAEAQGESFLQRNWRPVVMLMLTFCVMAHWLGYTGENLDPAIVNSLLDIVQVGLGGYVIGRSGEKIMREYQKK